MTTKRAYRHGVQEDWYEEEQKKDRKAGKDSSTSYSRFHHSTKCNSWPKRLSDSEWKGQLGKVNTRFDETELDEIVMGEQPPSNARFEPKDPNEEREACIFDDLPPASGSTRDPPRSPTIYRPMSLDEYREWNAKRRREYSDRYKANILRDLTPKGKKRESINPDYHKYNAIRRKLRTYYKFPVFYTYGRPVDESCYSQISPFTPRGNTCKQILGTILITGTLKEELNLRSVLPYLCQPEEESKGVIRAGTFEEYPNPLYTIEGVFERIPAILKREGRISPRTPGNYAGYLYEDFGKHFNIYFERAYKTYRLECQKCSAKLECPDVPKACPECGYLSFRDLGSRTSKHRSAHQEATTQKETRIECPECHQYLTYDHGRDEMTCVQYGWNHDHTKKMVIGGCGLTDIVDTRRYYLNPDLLPDGWTPPEQEIYFDGIGKGDLYHHSDSPEFPQGKRPGLEDLSSYKLEPEETSDDEDIIREARGDYDSILVGPDAKDVRDHGDFSLKRWTYSNPHKLFTHSRFCRTVFRRCRIGIENLPIHCCNRKNSKFCKKECEFNLDGLPADCHKHTGGSESEQCKGCEYAIESSLIDREHGREGLLDELSYPKLCYNTFSYLPVIFPTQVASNKTHESVLRFEKERLNHDWGIHLHGQTSEKTIKKYREDESIPWGLRHLVPSLKKDPRILYKHTPIGELLEAAPYQGSHALHYLNDYAELKHDLKFMKVFGEPTHDNLIGLIALREQENNKLNEDKGKNYRDLLITHKILNGFERITATVQLLYVNPACYQQEKLLPVRIDPGALGWHSTDTFWDLRISLIHRVSEHERAEMADIAEVIDYITQKKAHGTKKLMFSEIDDACRFSKGKSRALILNHPGKIKFYKIMPTVIVLQK